MNCKYPEIEVELIGNDGNPFAVMGAVSKALRQNGHASDVDEFMTEAMSGNYDHLLQTVMTWITVVGNDEDEFDDDSDYEDDDEE